MIKSVPLYVILAEAGVVVLVAMRVLPLPSLIIPLIGWGMCSVGCNLELSKREYK